MCVCVFIYIEKEINFSALGAKEGRKKRKTDNGVKQMNE